MCFEFDARPPAPPADLLLKPMAGGAGAELLELDSADGTHFSAAGRYVGAAGWRPASPD